MSIIKSYKVKRMFESVGEVIGLAGEVIASDFRHSELERLRLAEKVTELSKELKKNLKEK